MKNSHSFGLVASEIGASRLGTMRAGTMSSGSSDFASAGSWSMRRMSARLLIVGPGARALHLEGGAARRELAGLAVLARDLQPVLPGGQREAALEDDVAPAQRVGLVGRAFERVVLGEALDDVAGLALDQRHEREVQAIPARLLGGHGSVVIILSAAIGTSTTILWSSPAGDVPKRSAAARTSKSLGGFSIDNAPKSGTSYANTACDTPGGSAK